MSAHYDIAYTASPLTCTQVDVGRAEESAAEARGRCDEYSVELHEGRRARTRLEEQVGWGGGGTQSCQGALVHISLSNTSKTLWRVFGFALRGEQKVLKK